MSCLLSFQVYTAKHRMFWTNLKVQEGLCIHSELTELNCGHVKQFLQLLGLWEYKHRFYWVWLMCEPASRSREPRAASCEPIFASHCFFFLFIYFLVFSINVNVFLSKWFTLQKKHKFSIFFHAWNSAQAVAVVCWSSVYIQIWMKFLSFPHKILYQNVDYVKLTNVQIYTGKRSSEANFR